MNKKPRFLPALLALILAFGPPTTTFSSPVSKGHSERSRTTDYGGLPLQFETNAGQSDPEVRFLARGSGYVFFLTESESVLQVRNARSGTRSAIRSRFVKGVPGGLFGEGVLAARQNYLVGSSDQWQRDVMSYARVRHSGVYPGVDVVYYGRDGELEYDIVVESGRSPERIELEFSGMRSLRLDEGDLVLETDGEPVRHRAPVTYQQDDNGRKTVVPSAYEIRGTGRVGFRVGPYDSSRPLIIDPVIVYSSYLGGPSTANLKNDQVFGVAVDGEGNAYVTGIAESTDFPTNRPLQGTRRGGLDAFVTKINAAGTGIVYSTYIGGLGNDEGHAIAVDAAGNAYVTGYTLSSDFPLVAPLQSTRRGGQDVYVLKLNAAGSAIVYSTYLGGNEDERPFGIAVDGSGNAYVAGFTLSRDFPTANALRSTMAGGIGDVFVSKLNAAGNGLVYSTFYGGRGYEQAYGIAVDATGSAYVAGYTTSNDFPAVNAVQAQYGAGTDDAFVFKLNPDGRSAAYSTYIGGVGSENAVRIAIDKEGAAYITGYTSSPNFPVRNAVQPEIAGGFDLFVTKLSPAGNAYGYSTLWGGSLGSESGAGIAVDKDGSAFIVGFTTSFDLQVVNSVQRFGNIDRDAILLKLGPDGSTVLFSSYLGGFGNDNAVGIALDAAGNAYIGGTTYSDSFPLMRPFQTETSTNRDGTGSSDGFITKISTDDIRDNVDYRTVSGGGATFSTGGNYGQAFFGYAIATPSNGVVGTGIQIISSTQAGALVNEVGIPAASVYTAGRFFYENTSLIRGVLSVFNPNDSVATINFEFTDTSGTTLSQGVTTVQPRSWLSAFLNTAPYGSPSPFTGSMTFFSDVPVAATAFRQLQNERGEGLLSSIPITDLTVLSEAPQVIPHVADGGGWTSLIHLVNPSDDVIGGEIRFFSPGSATGAGSPLELQVTDRGRSSIFEYEIPPRGASSFQTAGITNVLNEESGLTESVEKPVDVGWVHVVPRSGHTAPEASAIVSSKQQSNVTVGETNIRGLATGQDFRFFIESTGDYDNAAQGSMRTAVALANRWPFPVTANLEATAFDGRSTYRGAIRIPGSGQVSGFLHQIPGFEAMPPEFKGTLRMTTPLREGFVPTALRARYNERNEFIYTTVGPINEKAGTASELIFVHLAEGAGYATQFVVLPGLRGGQPAGNLRFIHESGIAFNVTIR